MQNALTLFWLSRLLLMRDMAERVVNNLFDEYDVIM